MVQAALAPSSSSSSSCPTGVLSSLGTVLDIPQFFAQPSLPLSLPFYFFWGGAAVKGVPQDLVHAGTAAPQISMGGCPAIPRGDSGAPAKPLSWVVKFRLCRALCRVCFCLQSPPSEGEA